MLWLDRLKIYIRLTSILQQGIAYLSTYIQEEDNILVFPETSGFRGFETFFTEDSVQHPAKANLMMIKHIIEKYSKEGDTVLDPMSGTFSTSLIAGLLNRNGIGVEYEEKFYNMGLANKEKFLDDVIYGKDKKRVRIVLE